MTFKEKFMAEHPDCDPTTNGMCLGCPSDCGYDTTSNEDKNCMKNGGEGCEFCWDREIPKKSISIHGENVKRGLRAGLGLNEEDLPPTVADVAIAEMEADKKKSESREFAEIGKCIAQGFEDGLTANASDIDESVKPPVRTGDYRPDYIGPRILDSGNRRQFETGAVRDICEGKGRCDLLPLDVVGHALANPTFNYIAQYMREDGDYERLYDALSSCGIFHNYYTLFLEVAKHFEEGCKKYGDNNWQKGIPTHCYIDSAVRHYLKYLRGDKDEPHDRAFCWNILCCIWTCIHKPELNDYAKKEEE